MDAGATLVSRTPTRPVQVRLPLELDDFVAELARERGESKTQVVIEALECLKQQLLEHRLETGYRALAADDADLVEAGLRAALPAIPE
jgi:hypothetical protein